MLLIHRWDPLLNADNVAEAFTQLKRDGKVLYFGVSNFEVSQFELLASRLDFPLVTNQIEYSVINMEAQENGMLDMCQRLRISPLAWSPLGGGKIFYETDERAIRLTAAMSAIGRQLSNATIDQIALAWILKHPAKILPILGSGKIKRIRSAVKAENIALSRQQWFNIWRASKGREVP